jgi:hypothetical protein
MVIVMSKKSSRRKNNRRNRRKAKQSGWSREPTVNAKKVGHHCYTGGIQWRVGRDISKRLKRKKDELR